jgi:hypothetical protein
MTKLGRQLEGLSDVGVDGGGSGGVLLTADTAVIGGSGSGSVGADTIGSTCATDGSTVSSSTAGTAGSDDTAVTNSDSGVNDSPHIRQSVACLSTTESQWGQRYSALGESSGVLISNVVAAMGHDAVWHYNESGRGHNGTRPILILPLGEAGHFLTQVNASQSLYLGWEFQLRTSDTPMYHSDLQRLHTVRQKCATLRAALQS